jgi:hypothetical protein
MLYSDFRRKRTSEICYAFVTKMRPLITRSIIRGKVIKFVDCGFIASYYKVFTYTDPHRPSK